MIDYDYVQINQLDRSDLLTMLNKSKVREHLIEHPQFDLDSLDSWIADKNEMNATRGCRVRGIVSNSSVAGWCGIQLQDGNYEIAIVLDEQYWGLGKQVFTDIMSWAKELGHEQIYIHFLHTRPEYRFLRKISQNVFESLMHGQKFTTYQLVVSPNGQ